MDSAHALSARLAELLAREHGALADFLLALSNFDERRLWSQLGYESLFAFLHRELGLSKGAAHYRKVASELVRRFPEVIEPIRDGRLCFSSVVELARVMTPENRAEVVPRFFHRSKREAAAVAAEIKPAEVAPLRTVVTAVRPEAPTREAPLPAVALGQAVHLDELGRTEAPRPRADPPAGHAPAPAPLAAALVAPPARVTVDPLTGELSRLHMTVSRRFLGKLSAAKDALSHSHPGAGEEEILEAALDLLLETRAKRKAALVEKPRNSRPPADPGTITAAIKRAVWRRAGGRCEWRLPSGEVCGSTTRLEFDHAETPLALGGVATVESIRLHCRCHNIANARRVFGDAWMDRFMRRRRATEGTEAAPAAPPG